MIKLQIRRGKNSELPTLLDGEFGLSQDAKKLYIGNKGENIGIATDESVDSKLVAYRKSADSYSSSETDSAISAAISTALAAVIQPDVKIVISPTEPAPIPGKKILWIKEE